MADSPLLDADGVVTLVLKAGGQAIDPPPQVVSLSIQRAVGAIPSARLELADGDLQRFPLADSGTLVPGTVLEIGLGYGGSHSTVFKGPVVRFGLSITGNNDCRLIIECRDAAAAMTLERRSAHHLDRTDSAIAEALIGAHAGLTADVAATGLEHRELVQHHCTDWDFLLARAEVTGRLVVVTDGTVAVKPPAVDAEPVLAVTYGEDMISFQADIDARLQRGNVTARAWDAASQAMLSVQAAPPALALQGNLDAAALAQALAANSQALQSGGQVVRDALQAWAEGWQLRAGLARVRGRVSFQGSARVLPGTLLELVGIGARFAGKAFVGAVRHELRDGEWTTEAQLGLDPEAFVSRHDVMAPPAGGLLPGVHGLQVGVVRKLDADPDGQHRIQVALPALAVADDSALWARLLQFHASSGFGAFFLPEVGDEVLLGYLHADPAQPVVLGSLYSSRHAPPRTLEAANNLKTLVTRCGSVLEFDEADKLITVMTPAKNQVVLSDKDKTITLKDENGNKIVLGPAGILLDTPKDVVIQAKGNIKATATQAIEGQAGTDLKLSGLNVSATAQVGLKAQGTASAELSASGQTTVKGALVMIN